MELRALTRRGCCADCYVKMILRGVESKRGFVELIKSFPCEGRLWNFGGTRTHKIRKWFLTESTLTGAEPTCETPCTARVDTVIWSGQHRLNCGCCLSRGIGFV